MVHRIGSGHQQNGGFVVLWDTSVADVPSCENSILSATLNREAIETVFLLLSLLTQSDVSLSEVTK